MTALPLAILASTSAAVVLDLGAYANARAAFLADPIGRMEPRFDWRLFVARIALGLIAGIQIGLGINSVSNTAAPAALTTGGL